MTSELTTEEAGFFGAIDAAPGDRTNLLVFADWLSDRNDPREAGYRELARRRLVPWYFSGSEMWGWWPTNCLIVARNRHLLPSALIAKWIGRISAAKRVHFSDRKPGVVYKLRNNGRVYIESGPGTKPSVLFDAAAKAWVA